MIKISFGMIVLNGEPFIEYNLRNLYPFAHQIIIVEGAAPGAKSIANSQGHSNDKTLDSIQEFIKNEDTERKIVLVTAEDEGSKNGFWPGEKDEQSQAYAKRATGDYLWQVDSDEFYLEEDIKTIISMLEKNSTITAISFPQITFWGDPFTKVDSWYLRRGASTYHRLFKWGKGYKYFSHRPPTILTPNGIDTRKINWISGEQLLKKGIFLYHYSLLFPKQVLEKSIYYQNSKWANRTDALCWYERNYINLEQPFRAHNVYNFPGWLETWNGSIPIVIKQMWDDALNNRIDIETRNMDSVNNLLKNKWYLAKIWTIKRIDYVDRFYRFLRATFRPIKTFYQKIK